jgi:hypothetical protein
LNVPNGSCGTAPEIEKAEVIEEEIITVWVKGSKVMMAPKEALSLVNQVTGVLLAYEYTRGNSFENIPTKES